MSNEILFPTSEKSPYNFVITCAQTSDVPLLQAFLPLHQWTSRILKGLEEQASSNDHPFHENPKSIQKVEVVDVRAVSTRTGSRRVMFAMLNVFWKNPALTSMLFLKGPTVAMMIVLQPDDVPNSSEEDKYVVLTKQVRLGAASLQFCEIAAGMLDDNQDFVAAAAREIKEEIGIIVERAELLELKPPGATKEWQGVFPGPGALDEYIKFYIHQRRVPRSELNLLQGSRTGLLSEGEDRTLKVVRLEDMLLEQNAGMDVKAHTAWNLYNMMRADESGLKFLSANIVQKSLMHD